MEPVQLAAILAAVVVLASMISVELGIAVALIELSLGVVVGNVFSIDPNTDWLVFIAGFASIVLTFLAGLEIEPSYFRERWAASVGIGLVSFIGPFLVGAAVAYGLLDWSAKASLIAGTALSTTSLAVIYAVLVEDGLNDTRIGKLLMSATFVTDMATVVALSAIFIEPSIWFPVFLVASVALVIVLPRIAPPFFRRYG
ncbi:MAG: cation:proton antiporter, partial [Solirubrobacterales bacterium]